MKLPADPPDDRFIWRPLATTDTDALYEYYDRWETANNLPYRTGRDETAHNLADPDMDLPTDSLAGFAPEGSIVAVAWVMGTRQTQRKQRVFMSSHALPAYGDLEDFVIDWSIARAHQKLESFGDELPRVLRAMAEDHMSDYIARWQQRGFTIARYFVDMVRPLDEPIPDIAIPDGVTILTWDGELSRSAWEAHCEAFQDHWGSTSPTWDHWQHRMEEPHLRKDLSLMAVSGGDVVSYAVNGVYPHDLEVRGRTEGWIDTLGTRRAWRKRGLASTLIAESMRRFRESGLDAAALGVDVESPSGALSLYTGLGFREQDRAVALVKDYPG